MPLTTESLLELKIFFNSQLEATLMTMRTNDSDRLRKNKINGFLIALQDRLFELKPKLMCSGCGMAHGTNETSVGLKKNFDGQPARSNLKTEQAAQSSNIHIET